MAFTEITISAPHHRRQEVLRWRRRSRVVRVARLALPMAIGLIIGSMAGAVAFNALVAGPMQSPESAAPIRLTKPRLVGRDDQGRAFVITADGATRDPADYQRVILDRPALIMDAEGPDPVRLVAHRGVYNEREFKLDLHGGVKLVSSKAAFDTMSSRFDAKTGDVLGSGPIQGSGSLGEFAAKSYGVYGKGDRMIFKGGVRARLERK